mgnify:CR=1 FL=1
MAENEKWSDDAAGFINDIDSIVSEKYGIKLSDLLSNPEAFKSKADISTAISGMRDDIKNYFDNLMNKMGTEQEAFTKQLSDAEALYEKINGFIGKVAADSKFPYIKPSLINRDTDAEESIVITQYDDKIENLISKLIEHSNYAADLSLQYKSYYFGSWLFSGSKNYVLSVQIPTSPVLTIEMAMDEISSLFEDAVAEIQG